jgi:hypothetical protein
MNRASIDIKHAATVTVIRRKNRAKTPKLFIQAVRHKYSNRRGLARSGRVGPEEALEGLVRGGEARVLLAPGAAHVPVPRLVQLPGPLRRIPQLALRPDAHTFASHATDTPHTHLTDSSPHSSHKAHTQLRSAPPPSPAASVVVRTAAARLPVLEPVPSAVGPGVLPGPLRHHAARAPASTAARLHSSRPGAQASDPFFDRWSRLGGSRIGQSRMASDVSGVTYRLVTHRPFHAAHVRGPV